MRLPQPHDDGPLPRDDAQQPEQEKDGSNHRDQNARPVGHGNESLHAPHDHAHDGDDQNHGEEGAQAHAEEIDTAIGAGKPPCCEWRKAPLHLVWSDREAWCCEDHLPDVIVGICEDHSYDCAIPPMLWSHWPLEKEDRVKQGIATAQRTWLASISPDYETHTIAPQSEEKREELRIAVREALR